MGVVVSHSSKQLLVSLIIERDSTQTTIAVEGAQYPFLWAGVEKPLVDSVLQSLQISIRQEQRMLAKQVLLTGRLRAEQNGAVPDTQCIENLSTVCYDITDVVSYSEIVSKSDAQSRNLLNSCKVFNSCCWSHRRAFWCELPLSIIPLKNQQFVTDVLLSRHTIVTQLYTESRLQFTHYNDLARA